MKTSVTRVLHQQPCAYGPPSYLNFLGKNKNKKIKNQNQKKKKKNKLHPTSSGNDVLLIFSQINNLATSNVAF